MIATQNMTVGEALKWAGIASTGGQAKLLVRAGGVCVNGAVEWRRGRRVVSGDRIAVHGEEYLIVAG